MLLFHVSVFNPKRDSRFERGRITRMQGVEPRAFAR